VTREEAISRVRMIDLMLNANPEAGMGWRCSLDDEMQFLIKKFNLTKEDWA
jgi:hypothetical protein